MIKFSHILNKYPTYWTNTPHIEQIPHRLNKCFNIFISYINIRQIYINISCAIKDNCLGFPLWSFGIWNRCFNIWVRYIGSSWNGTLETSFDSDKLGFVCIIFKRNMGLKESGSNIYGRNIISNLNDKCKDRFISDKFELVCNIFITKLGLVTFIIHNLFIKKNYLV